jgi:hypothetical protein
MATQKFMGEHQLVKRLAAQVGDKGMAIGILKKRGDMTKSGTLTKKGKARDSMTAEERAKDRAVKVSSHPAKDFKYSARTNRATLKTIKD